MRVPDGAVAGAERLLQLVEERERGALIDLANWLQVDGVPLDQMDGSLDSLIPLWVWLKAANAAGFPQIDPDQTSIQHAMYPLEDDVRRRYVAAESLAFYLMHLCRRIDPAAHWAIELGLRVPGYGTPVVRFARLPTKRLFIMGNNCANAAGNPSHILFPDGGLRQSLVSNFGERPELVRPGASILAPLVGEPVEHVDYAGMTINIPRPAPRVAPEDLAHGQYYLAMVDYYEWEERYPNRPPEKWPPLPADAVAEFLNEARFTLEGKFAADDLRGDHPTRDGGTHEEYWAFAEVTVAGGEPRDIRFKTVEATKTEWQSLVTQIKRFANQIGAVLVR